MLVIYEQTFHFSDVDDFTSSVPNRCASTVKYKSEFVRSVSMNVTATLEVKLSHRVDLCV